jgi:PAS domain S-box-containing protein
MRQRSRSVSSGSFSSAARTQQRLRERVKELRCMYGIEGLIERHRGDLNGILKSTACIIPRAWQYPDATCARIIYKGQTFQTANFKKTRWRQSAEMKSYGKQIGIIEVYYLEKKPASDEGPFLKKERSLINTVAKKLARVAERIQAERDLAEYDKRLRSFTNSAPELYALYDSRLNCVEANDALLKFTGLSRRELLGKNLSEIAPNVMETGRYARYMEVIRTGKPFSIDELHSHPKFGERYFSLKAFKVGNGLGIISTDITERKKIEEKLHAASLYTRRLIEASLDPLVTISPKGKITDVNEATELVTGVPRDQLIGSDFSEYFTEPEKARAGYKKVLSEGYVRDYPLAIRDRSGKVTDVLYHATVYKDGSGKIQGIFAAARDITERKRMEEELRRYSEHLRELVEERTRELSESEERYRQLVEAAPDMIFAHIEGNLVFVNNSGARLLGAKNTDQLIGKQILDIIHPLYRETVRERIKRAREGAPTPPLELKYRRVDGSYVDVETVAIPFIYKGQQAVQGIARDITERRRMEEEIRSLARFPAENPNPVLRLSSEGAILYSNHAGFAILRHWGCAVGSKAPKFWQDLATEALTKRTNKELDMGVGEQVYSFVVSPVANAGYVNLYATDITERKRMESLKDQFIAAVTHELRTPLVSIKGYVDYILSGSLGTLPEKVVHGMRIVKDQSDRLLDLTDELLDYRRLTSGKFQLTLTALDLKDIINTCAKEIEPFIEKKKQTLFLDVPESPLPVRGDRARLVQVVINLFSNASKFSSESGQITLKAEKRDDVIEVSIQDKGIGIKKEDLARVFEPFVAIQKPSYIKGSGLGLSVSKALIEAHRGRIWAESEGEGKGTTFTFTIPESMTA